MESYFELKIKSTDPSTEKIIAEYDVMTKEDIFEMVKKSKKAQRHWNGNITKRSDHLQDVAAELRKRKLELARIATEEMGKPIKESLSEVEKCAWAMEFYADNGEIFLNKESMNSDARKTVISFEPLGVIGSIMPWNFPYWQALRFAAPSLVAGNTIVLKPASTTIHCGLEIQDVLLKAGLPEGIFQTIVGDSSSAESLIDSDINAVTFTGSVNVGAKVASRATSQLKKSVLELGGSDPFIVCSDADVEKASTGAVKGRFINCGQSCIASKRFFVAKDVAKEFVEKFVEKTEKLKVGDPLFENTDLGPLVNKSGLNVIQEQVLDAVKNGAELLTGGERVGNSGYFFKPTILKNISSKMRIFHEETFGPLAAVMITEDENEAVKLANESSFGLGATIWTEDLHRAEKLSNEIESGMVSVNNVLVSDPRVPFGGIKKSGFGRELSRYGMLEFVNIKSVRFYDQLIHNHHVE
jgi:succinate-semialdehyde dehydrogenase/glutarate-semialdehyde dehydrogenase/succinyl-CoA reductase